MTAFRVVSGLVFVWCGCATVAPVDHGGEPFSVVEASFADMQQAMASGRTSSKAIVREYLARIDRCESTLGATLALKADVWDDAVRLDEERANGDLRGPLHGIPIALKDNIHTSDMPTTGGALAFRGYTPPYEANLVRRLRAAGAIVMAKTTLTELANWVATGMPNSYNAVRGHGYNPYDTRRDPREGFDDGRGVTTDLYNTLREEELSKLGGPTTRHLSDAAEILDTLVLDEEFTDFLTYTAYDYLDAR